MMRAIPRWRRLPVRALAVAVLWAGPAIAEGQPLAERIRACAACHGADGNSSMANVPSLAGQPEFFLLSQLILMREGVRDAGQMAPLLNDLKDNDIEELAGHFAGLAPRPSDEPVDPGLVKRGTEVAASRRCGSCHLPTLAGQQQIPRLAGQRIDYLIATLKSYRDSPRHGADTAMSANIAGASDADIVALAHYCASL
jgi:cytochrome c553